MDFEGYQLYEDDTVNSKSDDAAASSIPAITHSVVYKCIGNLGNCII